MKASEEEELHQSTLLTRLCCTTTHGECVLVSRGIQSPLSVIYLCFSLGVVEDPFAGICHQCCLTAALWNPSTVRGRVSTGQVPPASRISCRKSVVAQPVVVPCLGNQPSSRGVGIATGLKEGARPLASIGVLPILLLANPKVLHKRTHQHEHLHTTQPCLPAYLLQLIHRFLGKTKLLCKELQECSCHSIYSYQQSRSWALLLQTLMTSRQGCVLK